MSLRDLLVETWSALTANKGRTLLTILGIVIGIASVIAMTSLIGGVKQSLVSSLGLEQARMVMIEFYAPGAEEHTEEDLRLIEENVEGYDFVTGVQYGFGQASTDTKQSNAQVVGVQEGFFTVMGYTLESGRLLSQSELASGSMSVVLDSTLARALFGDEAAVGRSINIENADYQVVGVVTTSNFLSSQGSAFMSMRTCSLRITGYAGISQIFGFASEGVDMDALTQRTESYLRSHYRISESESDENWGYVFVQSLKAIQDQLDSMLMSFQMLMTAVASISLLVGGIGIMNMMLTNVTERIREIGLRKALGARRRDITRQFLLESVAVCLVGGVIGFLLGLGGAWALSGVAGAFVSSTGSAELTIAPYVSWDTVLMAVGICVGIGVVFGIGPARRAAKLDPVESLRFQ